MFHSRIDFLKSKGLAPTCIYDIGANKGDWTNDMKQHFPNAIYELFEANIDNLPDIAKYKPHIILLGNENKDNVPFYKTYFQFNTGNSMFLEVSNVFGTSNYTTVYLPMRTLDTIIAEKSLPVPDFVKLDVQGAELAILQGMTNTLPHVKYFQIEVSFHRWNKDAPMAEEIITYMASKGYYMIDILEYHMIHGYTAQIDILFAHSSTGLRKENFYDC
jgi:FkbM family methyltransferase